MTHARHHLAVIDFGVGRTFDKEDSGQAAFRARQRMIDEDVLPGTSSLNSMMTAPPGGTVTVWMPQRRG